MKKIIIYILTLTCFSLTGCLLRPRVVDVQQGNVIEKSAVKQLKTGMAKDQVENIMGTPVLTNVFDMDTLTYVYTNQKNGKKIYHEYLTLYFTNNYLTKIQHQPLKEIPKSATR